MSEKGEVLQYVYQERGKSAVSLFMFLVILCMVVFLTFAKSSNTAVEQVDFVLILILIVLIFISLVQLSSKIILLSDEMVLYEGGLEINGETFLPWQKIESVELFWKTTRSNSRTFLCIYLKPDGDYKDPPLNRYHADYVINTSWMWNISAEEIAARCREQISLCKN